MPMLDAHFWHQNKSGDRNWWISSINFDNLTYFDAKNERRASAWIGTFMSYLFFKITISIVELFY